MSGFHRPGRHHIACTKREAPWACWRVAWKVSCILPRTTCEAYFRTFCILSCTWMADSNYFMFFLVWSLPETAMGILCNWFVGALPYAYYIISSWEGGEGRSNRGGEGVFIREGEKGGCAGYWGRSLMGGGGGGGACYNLTLALSTGSTFWQKSVWRIC